MYYECCVCKTSRKDAILHRFPCCENRLSKWLKCLLNQVDLKKLSPEQLSNLFICQKHFEKKFITSKSRLSGKAYPSLFSTDEITSGKPSQEFIEYVDLQTDHSYSRKRHFDHTYCQREPLQEIIASGSRQFQNVPSHNQPATSSEGSEIIASGSSQFQNVPGTSYNQPTTSSEDSEIISQFQNVPGTSYHQPTRSCEESAYPINSDVIASRPLDVVPPVTGSYKVRNVKVRKASRKRLLRSVKDLTPTCQIIYNEYKKAKQQSDFYRRAKRAIKFNKEKCFEKLTENMNPYAKRLINMQINLCTKSKKGRRFTEEEKLIALSIMKQSPKCYKFLHKIFILPSRSTLNKMVSKLDIKTGICPQVFELIKKEVAGWDDKKKLCSVIFDEMSLETALTYNKHKDTINGFVELNEKKSEFADHALVFMLRGAILKWQQPVAFYYCQGATKASELKTILKEVVSAVIQCGLKPVAIICDQGAAFQSALKSLKQDTKRDQILANQEPDGTVSISGVTLNIIYDPSHLIKGLRNNFLNKDIVIDGKISKWRDIIDVYETDCNHTEARLLHKLNDQHVIPEKIKKMKVKNCVKVFSTTVSAALSYTAQFSHYADGRPVSKTLKNTAETVLFFDQLFDSVNGAATFSKKNKGKLLRTAVTEKSRHHQFWEEAIKKMEQMKYIDSSGKEKSVPSLDNFIVTLKSYMRLWQILKCQGIKIMRPRYFNSDPIENFFGQVRAYNYRNNDPNCHSFNCTFKSLLITRIIKFHNETFNCEDDPADQVINLQSLFTEDVRKNIEPGHPNAGKSIEMIVEQARRERINVHSRAYTAGWVVRKIFNKTRLNCYLCNKSFTSEQSNIHDWISHREYTMAKNRLSYPSEGAVRCFGTVVTETNEYLEHSAHENNISLNIQAIILSKYSFDFINCTEHKTTLLNLFIALTVRFTIMNWCSIINRILKGTDIFRLKNRVLPRDHFGYLLKGFSIGFFERVVI